MRTRVTRHVSFSMTAWLLVVWLAVFGSLEPVTILGGLVVALAVQVVFPLPIAADLWHWRLLPLLHLTVRFIWDLIVAGSQVAWIVVTGNDHDDGIVKCEVRSNNSVYMTIVAAMTSMVPGTIVVEASRSEHALYLHVLDLAAHGGVTGVQQEVLQQEKRVLLAFAPDKVLDECGLGLRERVKARQQEVAARRRGK